MDYKKYFILLVPTLIAMGVIVFTFPQEKCWMAVLLAFVFWAAYYIWTFIDRRKRHETT